MYFPAAAADVFIAANVRHRLYQFESVLPYKCNILRLH